MKLSTKIILPIILISALLILLAGCFGVPTDESPGYTPGTITGIIAAPCCSTSAEPVSETSGAPEYWCYYCQETWSLQDGIGVVLTYGEDVVAATTTNEDGEFTFVNVPPGKNYVITAYCPDYDDNRPLVKDVALEVASTFDTKTTDLVSTSLGLVVDFLVLYTEWGPEDISLDEVLADRPGFPNFPKFKKLVYEVRRVLEICQNVNTDDDVQDALCRAAEEISKLDIGCAPGYAPPPPGPGPTPGACDGNLSAIIDSVEIDGVLVDPYDIVNVVLGESYEIVVTAHDQDSKLGTLTYYAKANGFESPATTSNQVTITPTLPGTFEVYVFVHDGCAETKWGPVTVVACCPFGEPGLTINIEELVRTKAGVETNKDRVPELIPDITICMEDCAIINSVTIHYGGTDPLPDLVITDFLNDTSLTWDIPTGIDFTKTTDGATVCLVGGAEAGTPDTYTIGVTYTDPCDNSVSDSVNVEFEECYTLTMAVDPSSGGTTTPLVGAHPGYSAGTVVDITAFPAECYKFDEWTGDVTGSDNPTTVTMDSDKTVTANFVLEEYTLTVTTEGEGSVTKDPEQGPYACGTVVTLTPQAEPCWYFDSWSGTDVGDIVNNGDGTYSITMDGDKTVTAVFEASPTADITLTARYDLTCEDCTDVWLWWHAPCSHTSGRDYMEVDIKIENATSSIGSVTIQIDYDTNIGGLDECAIPSPLDGDNNGTFVLASEDTIRFKKFGGDSGSPSYNPTQDGSDWTDTATVEIVEGGTTIFDLDGHEYCLTYDSIEIYGDDNQIRNR